MFLATLGHELRQPLTPMVSAISLMEQRISRETGTRAREIVKRQVGVLTRLVDDLLDAARVQQGKITLQRRVIDLRVLVEECLAAHYAALAARDLTIDTELPACPLWVEIDGARVHQILSNLLSNAARHSYPGGAVEVRADRQGDTVRLTIRDRGRGIDPAVLPHLFEPFRQETAGADGGLGLGLSIVRTLVELHGGSVQAVSAGHGQGAEFTVTLPFAAPSPEASSAAFADDLRLVAERIRAAAGTDDASELSLATVDTAILLADDDRHLLGASEGALALTGYSREELRQLHVPDLLAIPADGADAHWRRFVSEGRQDGILLLRRKDGVRVLVRYAALTNVAPGRHLSALEPL